MDREQLARRAAEAMGFDVDFTGDTFEHNPFGSMLGSIQHACKDLLTDPRWGLPMIRRIVEMCEGGHTTFDTCDGYSDMTGFVNSDTFSSGFAKLKDDPNHDLIAIATALVDAHGRGDR